MKCPICEVQLTMAERQGIEVDYCPQCRGVWLDRGELDKIIERAGLVGNEMQPPPTGDRRDRHDRYQDNHRRNPDDPRRRKRKSFLGELFDFD